MVKRLHMDVYGVYTNWPTFDSPKLGCPSIHHV